MATQGLQMKFYSLQNATVDENPHENERIRVILGCAISSTARAKHRCTGGWLILWFPVRSSSDKSCKCCKTSLMIHQHWLREWLGAISQQVMNQCWINSMTPWSRTSQGQNELNMFVLRSGQHLFSWTFFHSKIKFVRNIIHVLQFFLGLRISELDHHWFSLFSACYLNHWWLSNIK